MEDPDAHRSGGRGGRDAGASGASGCVPAVSRPDEETDGDLRAALRCEVGGGEGGKKEVTSLELAITAEITCEADRLIGAGALDGFYFQVAGTAAKRLALRVICRAVADRLNAAIVPRSKVLAELAAVARWREPQAAAQRHSLRR